MADEQATPRVRRRGRVLVALLVAVAAILAGLWLSRVPIARGVIERELARRGVPARYRIADLGFGRQRLTDVVVGDPAHPDLVADWIETHTDLSPSGARLVAVRAGHVRVRARWADGRLSLGAIDRLLPARGGGGAFTLPDIDLEARDARLRLETPFGVVGAALRGQGGVDDGFSGTVALAAEQLADGNCAVSRIGGALRLRSTGTDRAGYHGLTLSGPLRAARAACGEARVSGPATDLSARIVLGANRGSTLEARIQTAAASLGGTRADSLGGAIILAHRGGSALDVSGNARATELRLRGASAGEVRLEGIAEYRADRFGYAGTLGATGADVAALLPRLAGRAAGTPLAPLLDRAAGAAWAAAQRFSGEIALKVEHGQGTAVAVSGGTLRAASGARVRLAGGHQPAIRWRSDGPLLLSGSASVDGGGLPSLRAQVAQAAPGAPRRITLAMAPYAAGDARLALDPVRVVDHGGAGELATRVTLSGPLADGRVDGLTMPLALSWRGDGTLALGPACTPVAFRRLAVAGLVLDPARVALCPSGGALVRVRAGAVSGGATMRAVRLGGTLGGTPLALAARQARLSLGDDGEMVAEGVQARLGQAGRVTRLDVAQVSGVAGPAGIAGRFAGAAGQIANVPLLLSDAGGSWRLAGGRLALDGALRVSDAAPQPRFQQLDARAVRLQLVNGAIAAQGQLVEPSRGVAVADVTLRHALSSGTGAARLDVPGITFGEGFQPELLTRLTFGVIADVRGRVAGRGDIAWSPDGVTSTGTFSTDSTDLAAAFGPVEGIAGTIRFTDLLALQSAPDQVLSVRSINPGVPVTDGRIVYQTLPDTRIRVTEGRWPFAGGTLTLAPTLLDFSSEQVRRMTFDVRGMDAARFLQQFDFKNLNATGVFDGTLPMLFDAGGGRIEGGELVARAGGGSIAYVGELSEKELGFWGDFAFQALRSLTYRTLEVQMDGPLAGELVTAVRFAGVRQGEGAKSNFLVRRLTRLPIVFNIRIRAPFRSLIDSTASFYDPSRLVTRNLQQLIDAQNRATQAPPPAGAPVIQPPASEKMP